MHVTGCNYLVDLNPKVDRLRTALAKARSAGDGKQLEEVLEPAIRRDVKDGRAFCKADFDAPFQTTFSLDQIAETFGLTRPRVQQIEARAREKIEKERAALEDFVVESPDQNGNPR
jgi:DNA-directed RNA polymerase sigma subunit (sigma70/sigma32)